MLRTSRRIAGIAAVAATACATLATVTLADSTPIGPLPPGPSSAISTQKGELVAIALPDRASGRVWRVARPFDANVVQQVSEANVGHSVVLVFKATGSGKTTVSLALTRGERAKAYEARRFTVTVR